MQLACRGSSAGEVVPVSSDPPDPRNESPEQRDLYVTTLLLAALATALLLAPVAYHRIVFRRRQKEHLIRAANVLAILGLVTVGLAVSAAVALVLSYVVAGLPTILITIILACLFAGLWFAFPLTRRE
jgi:fatty acid desaturase